MSAENENNALEGPEPLMRYFEYAHLPAHLQDASSPFWLLADRIVRTVPPCAERTAALRKLLEGKDCAVRAMLPARPSVESADRFRGSILTELADAVGGTIEEAHLLPDGHGFAVMSMPLPKDHWLTANPEAFNVPPMPLRMAGDHPHAKAWHDVVREAGKYACRCATMNGKDNDFDPDALLQNLLVGLFGYFTADGLSSDEWANPERVPPLFDAPAIAGTTDVG